MWLFEFVEEDDKRRVLAGRPWYFDRQILVLNEFDGQSPPSQIVFTQSPFWIQVHDMPLLCMTRGVGSKIGESLRVLEDMDVDVARDGAGRGRCLKIRVTIYVSKPLERGRALSVGDKSYWVEFKYEKLPLFCFICGCVIHGRKGCPEGVQQRMSTGDEGKQWGVWLRAEPPKWQNYSGHESGGGYSSSEDHGAITGGLWS